MKIFMPAETQRRNVPIIFTKDEYNLLSIILYSVIIRIEKNEAEEKLVDKVKKIYLKLQMQAING